MPTNPADIYNYNPWVNPNTGGTPYYNPFDPNLGYQLPEGGALPITSPIAAPACEENYVLDEETNTCVPIEVAIEAVKNGDRNKSSFAPVSDGQGGFISFADMFDGGGAGFRGRNFEGGIGNLGFTGSLIQRGLNWATDPTGAAARSNWDKPIQALSDMSTDELIEKGYIDKDDVYNPNTVASDHYKDAESGSAKIIQGSDDGDKQVVVKTYNTQDVLDKGNKDKHGNTVVKGKNMGGPVMNPLVSYRQNGGPLPGAVPPMGAQPELPPAGPPMAPPAPVAPPAPPMPPAPKSFAERVEEARMVIKSGRTSVPSSPELKAPMVDAQGDGPVEIMQGAGSVAPGMVGPDMGVDTIDSELEEGSFVLNPEASEMYGDEIRAMCRGGKV